MNLLRYTNLPDEEGGFDFLGLRSSWSRSSVTFKTPFPCSSEPLFEGEPSDGCCCWSYDSDEPTNVSDELDSSLEYSIMPGIDLMQTMCGVSGFRMNR